MPDTKRSMAEIIALLTASLPGDISAQDVRDAVVTLRPDYGTIYLPAPAVTTISDSVSFFAQTGDWTLAPSYDWDNPTDGRLRYFGTSARQARVWSSLSVTCGTNNQLVEAAILLNGVAIEASRVQLKIGTGADVVGLPCMANLPITPGDYIQAGLRNLTSTADLTCVTANIFTIGLPA